jgi:AraC-like DNA-binding protein
MFTLVLVEQGLLDTGARSFPAGALILFRPPAPARRDQPGTRLRAFSFGRSLADPLAFDASATRIVEMLGAPGPVAARLSGQAFAEARTLFDRLEREDEARGPGFEAMIRLKVMEALLLLSRAMGLARGAPGALGGPGMDGVGRRFDVEEAKRWIQEHHADPLSLGQIASLFGNNPSYFSRLFHREAGVSLVEYINRVRIQHSCQLLKRSNAGIMEIAMAVGYNNISHFNRFFRRLMDMSPREYRISSRK